MDARPSLHVIVADDCGPLREAVTTMLRRDGHSVHQVSNGAQLLQHLSGDPGGAGDGSVDLVISDMHMPGPSGIEVLRRLREDRSAIPFVLMTADRDERLRDRARDLGAPVLDKPFNLAALRAVVSAAMARAAT